ncbi:MAG: M3 family metallopeptidase [Planctomycetota bacterium]
MEAILSKTTEAELREFADEALKDARSRLQQILDCSDPATPENTLKPLDELFRAFDDARHGVGFLRSVHPKEEFRQTCESCEQDLARFMTELGLNRELYQRVCDSSLDGLDDDGRRMHEHCVRDFKRSGVDRDDETRAELEQIRRRLVELGQEFARNILSDVRKIEMKPEELEGLPEDYLKEHAPGENGLVEISTDYPDYHPFMSYARSGERRKELFIAFRNRAYPANEAVLAEILKLRHRLSGLLGYDHWADYVSETKMIRNGASIREFIGRVAESADEVSKEEYEQLLTRKRRDDPNAKVVADWEKGYYEEIIRAEEYRVDSRELRPYFEYSACMDGVLDVASRLFSIEFRRVEGANSWHEDVAIYDVFEAGDRVGRVYLDMHPREGKFKHAAMFPLVQGVRGGPVPEAALVCNFPRPGSADDGPALLEHDDVVTIFHEFGHLLHHLFGRKSEWVQFSGTSTEWDFVEVPSQLLEEWGWDVEVVQGFARHYESGEPIPEELVARLRAARDFGRGIQVRQQMYYASLSVTYHDSDPASLDLDGLQEELQAKFSRFPFVEGTHFHTSFGHLDGYSALYYTYMWSLVIAKDVFSAFQSGIMDPGTAKRYREAVLAPGGSRDAVDLVREFLGRDYSFEAFENWLRGNARVA